MTEIKKKRVKKVKEHSDVYDCAIIGGGPGGLISALYLRRFRRKVILVNAGKPRAAWGKKVRNLIGYDRGISGIALLKRIEKQLQDVGGLDRIQGEAEIFRVKDRFEVAVSNSKTITAKKVIIATGITDVHPQVSNLKKLRDLGLLKYCSICDGFEIRNKPVAVLVKDTFGIEKALFIGNWTKKIKIIAPFGFKPTVSQAKKIREIGARIVLCRQLVLAPFKVNQGIVVQVDKRAPFIASVAYVELGCEVNDSAFSKLRGLRRAKNGFIVATTEQRTSIPGLFAVGDCVNLLGQISVASGQAAVAATTIHNDLL